MLSPKSPILLPGVLCNIYNFQKHIHYYNWCDFEVEWEIFGTTFDFDLILLCDLFLR